MKNRIDEVLATFDDDEYIEFSLKEIAKLIQEIKATDDVRAGLEEFLDCALAYKLDTVETVVLIGLLRNSFSIAHLQKEKWEELLNKVKNILIGYGYNPYLLLRGLIKE